MVAKKSGGLPLLIGPSPLHMERTGIHHTHILQAFEGGIHILNSPQIFSMLLGWQLWESA